MTRSLPVEPLTREAFAPFGQVIDTDGAERFAINQGTATRFHRLAAVEAGDGGRAILSIFRATARPAPFAISLLERHPLASQAFVPLSDHDWLVVVAERPETAALRCFCAGGRQGVQYAPGVWHHPLLVLVPEQDFLVVDREGPGDSLGDNLEEVVLRTAARIDGHL